MQEEVRIKYEEKNILIMRVVKHWYGLNTQQVFR